MYLAIVGTGYVGAVSAACFAELGHNVIGIDIDKEKIRLLAEGKSPIYEPGLTELLSRGLATKHLSFTTDLAGALPNVSVVFSAVATPPGEGYRADLRAVFTVAETVARHADHDLVFVNKSTVPVGTGAQCEKRIAAILKERGISISIPVVSNPEFLREGMAVYDTLNPDRTIVGVNDDTWAEKQMTELYRPLSRTGKPLMFMNRESAELVKYASNAFLATKISFINELTELAERTGANIRDVAKGMGLDSRIGPRFLHAGIGYGGSCFPKDVRALLATAKEYDVELPIVEATDAVNTRQRKRFCEKVLKTLPPSAAIAVWGLSFKPKTDDMREAPSLDIIPQLLNAGHAVRVFDPQAMSRAKELLPKEVSYANDPIDAAMKADATLLLTEWDVFRGVDLKQLKEVMRGADLFDGRNVYEPDDAKKAGLTYHGIGISS